MMFLAGFVSGFASGWIVRSSVDSTRGADVRIVAGTLSAVDRAKRVVALEREYFEDLVAEGRARYKSARARARAGVVSIVKEVS